MAWNDNKEVEGYTVAIGVVSLLFFIRAAATEYAGKDVHPAQKDIIWGLSLGSFLTVLRRLLE